MAQCDHTAAGLLTFITAFVPNLSSKVQSIEKNMYTHKHNVSVSLFIKKALEKSVSTKMQFATFLEYKNYTNTATEKTVCMLVWVFVS